LKTRHPAGPDAASLFADCFDRRDAVVHLVCSEFIARSSYPLPGPPGCSLGKADQKFWRVSTVISALRSRNTFVRLSKRERRANTNT